MSELPDRVGRAFRDHGSFERVADGRYESTATVFDATVEVEPATDGRIEFRVTVRVPMLDEVTDDEVAPVVEEGWYDTFALRAADPGGVTSGERDLDPRVYEKDREAVVEASFEDINERRGIDDAAAVVDYVEGTFVEGIIPGYDYREPVESILNRAHRTGGSDHVA